VVVAIIFFMITSLDNSQKLSFQESRRSRKTDMN